MAYETIRYDVADDIATVTLARAGRMNAIDGRMIAELLDAIDRSDGDDAVRAVIVTGEGRAFSVGADLSRGADMFASPADDDDAREPGGTLALRLFDALKPVIGAINGDAVGLGVTMTLPMDVRIASGEARFGFVFARRGMVPEAASTFFLPRLVGISNAVRWCSGGRLIGADEALAAGLVSEVHAPGALAAAARAIAREMIEGTSPVSVAMTRRMMWRGLTLAHPADAHRIESRALLARGRAADVREGVSAFLDKRRPAFPDRVSRDMPAGFSWTDERGAD